MKIAVASIVVPVQTVSDFTKRSLYSSINTVVTFNLLNNLTVTQPIVFDFSFSFSTLAGNNFSVMVDPSVVTPFPVLILSGVNDFSIKNVILVNSLNWTLPCANYTSLIGSQNIYLGLSCPVLMISNSPTLYRPFSSNIIVANNNITGTVVLDGVNNVTVDSNFIQSNDDQGAVVTVLNCGNAQYIASSLNVVSNNEIVGGMSGLQLYKTVGVVVKNNFIHDFAWLGFQCGNATWNFQKYPPNLCVSVTITNNVFDRGHYDGYYVSPVSLGATLIPPSCVFFHTLFYDVNNSILSNYFVRCGWAIYFAAYESFMTIAQNLDYNDRSGFLRLSLGYYNTIHDNLVMHNNSDFTSTLALIDPNANSQTFTCPAGDLSSFFQLYYNPPWTTTYANALAICPQASSFPIGLNISNNLVMSEVKMYARLVLIGPQQFTNWSFPYANNTLQLSGGNLSSVKYDYFGFSDWQNGDFFIAALNDSNAIASTINFLSPPSKAQVGPRQGWLWRQTVDPPPALPNVTLPRPTPNLGSCLNGSVVILINSTADFNLRLIYSKNTWVTLKLNGNLNNFVLLNSSFSCTIIDGFDDNAGINHQWNASSTGYSDASALNVTGVTNFKVANIDFTKMSFANNTFAILSFRPTQGILQYGNIWVQNCSFFGQVLVDSAWSLVMDNNLVTCSPTTRSWNLVNLGSLYPMIDSGASLTRNNFAGNCWGLAVQGIVGMRVLNNLFSNTDVPTTNYIMDFGDYLSSFNNLFYFEFAYNAVINGQIYTDTHYSAFGNTIHHNYILNNGISQMMYLDVQSSGLSFYQNVFYTSVPATLMKFNTGNSIQFSDNIFIYANTSAGNYKYLSQIGYCKQTFVFLLLGNADCSDIFGFRLYSMRRIFTPDFAANAPHLLDTCNRGKTNGKICNPLIIDQKGCDGFCMHLIAYSPL